MNPLNIFYYLFNKDEIKQIEEETTERLRPVWKREGLREFQDWANKHKSYTRTVEIVDEYIKWEEAHAKTPQL